MVSRSTWAAIAMGLAVSVFDLMRGGDVLSWLSGVLIGVAAVMPLVDVWQALYERRKALEG